MIMKAQSILVTAILVVAIALGVLYLGFMTHYYILFYDGTTEMFDYYKQLQVFNKEAFNIALLFIVAAGILYIFGLRKIRPGGAGLLATFGVTAFVTLRSLALINVIPLYKKGYLALDFAELEEYSPSTFVFDLGMVLHIGLMVLTILLAVTAAITFTQRLREGCPLIRGLAS